MGLEGPDRLPQRVDVARDQRMVGGVQLNAAQGCTEAAQQLIEQLHPAWLIE
jgi:hypothetical protein